MLKYYTIVLLLFLFNYNSTNSSPVVKYGVGNLLETLQSNSPEDTNSAGNDDSEPETNLISNKISEDSWGYLKVGSVFAGIMAYSIALVIVPTSLVLLSFIRLVPGEETGNTAEGSNTVERNIARGLNLIDTYTGFLENGRNCLRRISCDVAGIGREKSSRGVLLSWFLSTRFGKLLARILRRSDTDQTNCGHYSCFGNSALIRHGHRSKRLIVVPTVPGGVPEEEADYEFSFVSLQRLLKALTFTMTNGEENDLDTVVTTVGSWAKFSAAVLILGIPVTIFVVALFLVGLVTVEDSDEEAAPKISNQLQEINKPSVKRAVQMLHETKCSDSKFCKYMNMEN